MDNLKIEANYRSNMTKSRAKRIRRDGYVTGSVFGHGAEPVSVELKLDDLVRQVKQSDAGLRSLIDLKIKGAPRKCDGMVIVKSFHRNPLSRKVLDVSFQRINLKESLHVGIPVELVGEAPGSREGGILEQLVNEIQVSCLPGDIPPRIEIDVSGLAIGDLIRAGDVTFDGDVELLSDPDTVLVNCRPPHVAVAVEAAAEAEAAEAEAAPAAEGEAEAEAKTEEQEA